uniref:E3 ubiquitin-protein ligase APD1-4 middle domain-containing protein n=1 Tax=Anopheles stephensi TaxID=30069 RepID=A0A182YDL8_ANOST
MAQNKRLRYVNNADNVAYYHVYKYNSLQRLNKNKSMHGVKRVVAFCILTAILPASLIILPLYLRHTVFADVVYPIAESDIIEIRDGISSVFCQKHTLQMNSTFNAFQLDHEPEVSKNRKHIRLKKSMSLPDDTLEYWGFYLLKGATVALKVCSRYDGSRILVVKGERNLRTCGLLEHNNNKIDNYLNKEHGQVLVTFESAAEFIEYSGELRGTPNLPADGNHGGEDLTEERLSPEESASMLHRVHTSKESRTRHAARTTDNELNKRTTAAYDTSGRKAHHATTKRIGRPVSVTIKNVQTPASTTTTTTSTTTEVPTSTTENLVKKYRNFRATEAGPSAEESVDDGGSGQHRRRHSHNKTGHRQQSDAVGSKDQEQIVQPDSVDRSEQPSGRREGRRRRRRDLVYDRAINHGGTAMNYSNNTSDSVSSFENSLLSCYDGDILLAHSFPPSKSCQSVKYLEGASHTVTKHEVVSDGYYYYIFYSDNDYVQNDIHAMFDIYKPTFQYSNISDSKGCINSTHCSFPITFWSNERVIVEVPTRDGIEHEEDDITLLVSTCHPRMAIYIIFPVSVLILVLTCAFL